MVHVSGGDGVIRIAENEEIAHRQVRWDSRERYQRAGSDGDGHRFQDFYNWKRLLNVSTEEFSGFWWGVIAISRRQMQSIVQTSLFLNITIKLYLNYHCIKFLNVN